VQRPFNFKKVQPRFVKRATKWRGGRLTRTGDSAEKTGAAEGTGKKSKEQENLTGNQKDREGLSCTAGRTTLGGPYFKAF